MGREAALGIGESTGMIGKFSSTGKYITPGKIKNIPDLEASGLNRLLQVYKGDASVTDQALWQAIDPSQSGFMGTLRKIFHGQDGAAQANAGERVENISKAGQVLENVIGAASKRRYLAQGIEKFGTARAYDGLLGFAVDTAAKNLGQALNNVGRFGVAHTLQGMGGVMTKEWQEYMLAKNVIQRTNSHIDQAVENAMLKDPTYYDRFRDIMFSPMHVTENFNRGTTLFAGMAHHTSQGKSIQEAARLAEEAVREMQFSYSSLDMSPFFNAPFIKPAMQFMSYPLKQIEFLARSAQNGQGTGNEFLRYLIYNGGIVGYGHQLGLDVKNVFVNGLFDQTPSAPSLEAAGLAASSIAQTAKYVMGQGSMESPSKFWSDLGKLSLMTLPGGRYGTKVLRNEFESGGKVLGEYDPVQVLFGDDWNLKKQMANHPALQGLFDATQLHPDPNVDPIDRVTNLLGIKTLHTEARRDFLKFEVNFFKRYREAQGAINGTVAEGGDWMATKTKWVNFLQDGFGPGFRKYKLPEALMYQQLGPTIKTGAQAERRRAMMEAAPEARAAAGAPKQFRPFLQPLGGVVPGR